MIGFVKAVQVAVVVVMTKELNHLARFGFRSARGGAHSSRTLMLDELTGLLGYVDRSDATKVDYLGAIEEENCLGKRSGKTRRLTYRHLAELYSLDTAHVLFRSLLYFWHRDDEGQPMLSLLATYARDSIFRTSAPMILKAPEESIITRDSVEGLLDSLEPGRFSKATLKSTAQNINSSWTKSGHLSGRKKKVRSQAKPTAGSTAFALLLGYLSGARGQILFVTEYAKLLDCPKDKVIELAEQASRKGWINYKRVGDVIEVLFPKLINQEEQEWLREQS